MYDPQEAKHLAGAGQVFYATVAESEGDEEASGPGTRVDGFAAKREGCEADHRGTESRTSRLGKLLPDGERRSGVQQAGWFRFPAHAALAVSARRATGDKAEGLDRRSTLRDGFASTARHGVLSVASHINKIIVKLCAG